MMTGIYFCGYCGKKVYSNTNCPCRKKEMKDSGGCRDRMASKELAAAKARIAELEAALTSLAHGDGCFMEAAYKEGWSDAGSPYDFEHAESSWEESHAAGDARRAAALLKEDNQ